MNEEVIQILNKVGMGGTFDHLHEGHKYLISTALSVSKNVVIGLTSESLLRKKKYFSKMQSYGEREKALISYISKISDISRVKIVKLEDPYGPPIHEKDYEGIIVSQETYQNALTINKMRESNGFKPMIIIIVPILKNSNNEKISSTAIRAKIE
jgi:pantetheine-phosphate adenylyltransferase